MTKNELRQMIREVLKEELYKRPLKEAQTLTDRNFKNLLMKSLINNGDRDIAKQLHQHELFSSANIAPGTVTINKSGTVCVHTSLLDPEQIDTARAAVKKAITSVDSVTEAIGGSTLDWNTLIAKADTLLYELIRVSGNTGYDDGDGYWQEEYTTWCNRYLYYTRLANVTELEKLCKEYSKKLPNVEFYFYDDIEDDVSEIGYVASRN